MVAQTAALASPIALALFVMLVACGSDGTHSTAATSTPAPVSAPPPASVTASAPKQEQPPEEVSAQHVLIAYKGAKNAPMGIKRTKDDAKKLAEEIRTKAVGGADFSELAKQHSDDPASKDRLGSLGKFKRTEMVPPVADAAFGLAVGAISAVVESPFGFHVLKRNQ